MALGSSIIGKVRRQYVIMRYGRWTTKKMIAAFACLSCLGLAVYSLFHAVFTIELLPWKPGVDNWCAYEDVPEYMLTPAPDEMTVVTMFINLGVFKKGEGMYYYHSPHKYYRWMRTFGKMVNRVVAYIEDEGDIEYFRKVRSCLPASHTKIIKVRRSELPSFKHLPEIRRIYSQPSYPKRDPDTVFPEYACTMHAKYDVLERSVIMDFYRTPYFAWVDVGLFRQLDGTDHSLFKLVPPEKFNPERVGMSQVMPLDPVHTPEFVMKNSQIWVSGSMVLATKEYMLNFTREYKQAVSDLLKEGLSNSDQGVIYAMYTARMRRQNQVKVKTYLCHQGQLGLYGSDSRYFCLGYVCKNAWEKRVPHVSQRLRSEKQR
ncbi:uncharacterized protein LOC101853400 [Aplysia californica]|uniref:Uncharacterized protein LOC101853400 n=1 Tax=Aplysia californica TaxID=6500 RepID=A0ABM0JWV3_APLCA|nr:uncharacterized protein LOC101853400 [Aplysia californica]